jgi:hypothetical protein
LMLLVNSVENLLLFVWSRSPVFDSHQPAGHPD